MVWDCKSIPLAVLLSKWILLYSRNCIPANVDMESQVLCKVTYLQCCLQLANIAEIFPPCKQIILRENSHIMVSLTLTFLAKRANFVHGVMKPLLLWYVSLQSMASIGLDKHGILAQLRWKDTFSWWHYSVYSDQALRLSVNVFKWLLGH